MSQKNTSAYILLGLLEHEPASGYDLKKKADVMISQFWNVGYWQIYPTLKELEKEEAISSRPSHSNKGPDRIEYQITDKGKEKLADWLEQLEEKEYVRYEILLKLFFGKMSSPENNRKRIEAFQKRHERDLEQIRMFKSNLERVLAQDEDHFYYYLTVLFGEHIYKAYTEWAEEALQLIAGTFPDQTDCSRKDLSEK